MRFALTTKSIKSTKSAAKVSRVRRGMSLIYASVAMTVLGGFTSLAVDFGRVTLVKNELRRAAEAGARAAAAQLSVSPASAIAAAEKFAEANKADASSIDLKTAEDVELGKWDTKTRTFTKLSPAGYSQANAVRVIARRVAARKSAVPLVFGQIVGRGSMDVSEDCVAMLIPAISVDQNVQATASPFLAAMPKGTVSSLNNPHNSPDYAGDSKNAAQSPQLVGLPLTAGAKLTFDSISGTAAHDPNLPYFHPDGELTDIGGNTNGAEHGISDTIAPINALVGVFLTDEKPSMTAAPATLDFSTAASRDYSTLEPKVKQIFFIGDGRTTAGAKQEIVVPEGATRLMLATWDFFEWNNNLGYRNVQVNRPMQIITVR